MWTWSLCYFDEGEPGPCVSVTKACVFSPVNTSLKMIYFMNMQYLSFWLCWKNSLDFCDFKDIFFLQLSDPFIDLICLQLLQGKELQILFFLELVYIYFFPYLTWIVISLFLSFFCLDCYFFISFLLWLELLLFYFFPSLAWIATFLFLSFFGLNCYFFISFLLDLFPYLFPSFPSLQFCTFSSLPQYFFFFAAISHNCTHTTPCLHFINH